MTGSTAMKKRASQGSRSDRDAGASPLFPPVCNADAPAKEALLRWVRRDPRTCGVSRARWRLADLLAQCPDWQVRTAAGMWGILDRLGISYQRGRDYIHSPDPDYLGKIAAIEAVLAEV